MVWSVCLTYWQSEDPINSVDWGFIVAQYSLIASLVCMGNITGLLFRSVIVAPIIGLSMIMINFLGLSFYIRNFFTPGAGTPSTVFLVTDPSKLLFRGLILLVTVLLVAFLVSRQNIIRGISLVTAGAILVFALPSLAGEDSWLVPRKNLVMSCHGEFPEVCSPQVMADYSEQNLGRALRAAYAALPTSLSAALPQKITLGLSDGPESLYYDPIRSGDPTNRWLTIQEVLIGSRSCGDGGDASVHRNYIATSIFLGWMESKDTQHIMGVQGLPNSISDYVMFSRAFRESKDERMLELVHFLRDCSPLSGETEKFIDGR
ncbi:hypothetical protein JT358_03670 [Micrococcales bacterium 31B]|nr:hypothetical protein [Micrococcales bacterium 31B]